MICGNCGRKLKDVKSIERGYGPVCWGKFSGTPAGKMVSVMQVVKEINIPGQMEFEDYPGVMPEEKEKTMRICKKCGKEYGEVPGVSREDGSLICRKCSEREALEAAVQAGAISSEQSKTILAELQPVK